MIARIIRASVGARGLVLAAALVLTIIGVATVKTTPVDALPDLSDVQVIIRTTYPGQAPQIVENQVTVVFFCLVFTFTEPTPWVWLIKNSTLSLHASLS